MPLNHPYLLYPCGHNVVIYSLEDKSQRFIPGIQGTDGITALALSSNKKTLAVCEKAVQAVCSVYNIDKVIKMLSEKKNIDFSSVLRKRKVLTTHESEATHFISVDFCSQDERLLVTLGNDCRIIVW